MEITCDGLVWRADGNDFLAVGMTNKAELIQYGRENFFHESMPAFYVTEGRPRPILDENDNKNEPEPNRDCFYPGSFRVNGRPR
jgi:hypothetical protein